MKEYVLFFLLFAFLSGCSNNKETEISIKNKNDSLNMLIKSNEDAKKEIEQLKQTNEALNKELSELKKNLTKLSEGPSEDVIKNALKKYVTENTGRADSKVAEFKAKVIGKRESGSNDLYIAQCTGSTKIFYPPNAYQTYDYEAEVNLKKFGNEWQSYSIDFKRNNLKTLKE